MVLLTVSCRGRISFGVWIVSWLWRMSRSCVMATVENRRAIIARTTTAALTISCIVRERISPWIERESFGRVCPVCNWVDGYLWSGKGVIMGSGVGNSVLRLLLARVCVVYFVLSVLFVGKLVEAAASTKNLSLPRLCWRRGRVLWDYVEGIRNITAGAILTPRCRYCITSPLPFTFYINTTFLYRYRFYQMLTLLFDLTKEFLIWVNIEAICLESHIAREWAQKIHRF